MNRGVNYVRKEYNYKVITNALKESQQSFAMSKKLSEMLLDLMEINFGVDETARIAEKAIKITKGLIEDKGENNVYEKNVYEKVVAGT